MRLKRADFSSALLVDLGARMTQPACRVIRQCKMNCGEFNVNTSGSRPSAALANPTENYWTQHVLYTFPAAAPSRTTNGLALGKPEDPSKSARGARDQIGK